MENKTKKNDPLEIKFGRAIDKALINKRQI